MQPKKTENSEKLIKILAEIIREERLKQNKSQRLLAYEYEIQKSLLSRLENANNEPMLISILMVCEALNLKYSELFVKLEQKLPEKFSLLD